MKAVCEIGNSVMSTETAETEGVYTLFQALSLWILWNTHRVDQKDPKEVSVVVQTQERETAAMLKGQEILHRPFSPMSFMEQKP